MAYRIRKTRANKSLAVLLSTVLIYLSCFAELTHINQQTADSRIGKYVSLDYSELNQHQTVCTLCIFQTGPEAYTENETAVSPIFLLCLGCVFLNSIAPPLVIESGLCELSPDECNTLLPKHPYSYLPTSPLQSRAPPA